jgi:hypothetical protein
MLIRDVSGGIISNALFSEVPMDAEGRTGGGYVDLKASMVFCGGTACLKRSWHDACIIKRLLCVIGILNVCAILSSFSEWGMTSRRRKVRVVPTNSSSKVCDMPVGSWLTK